MEELNLETELIRASNPFPWITENGELKDGVLFVQPKICRKCPHKECKNLQYSNDKEKIAHSVCPKGMSIMIFKFTFGNIISNGLIEMSLNKICKPIVKKHYKTQKVTFEAASRWYVTASSIGAVVNTILEKRVKESIQSLHDIFTAVRLVKTCATRIIKQYRGTSDDEKIESAPDDMKVLFKSVLLLTRRLEMSSIIANPEAAGFGQKRQMPIYKVFDLICKLFEEIAHWDKGKHIRITGSSFKTPPAYDSFETLVLVLIDNAVKYCSPGEWVTININDIKGGVSISVENPGPLVAEQYRKKIFEKGFRTPLAKDYHASGRGFGLYIASIIAKVHGFNLEYLGLRSGLSSDPSYGTNAFRFIIPD